MNIDKNRFLLLTTTLAATAAAALVTTSGCTTTDSTSNDAGPSPLVDSGNVTPNDDASTGDGGNTSDGGVCLSSTKPAPFCAPPLEGDFDAGDAAAAKCPTECTNFSALYKTDVAQEIKDCMDVAPTTEGGCADSAYTCVEKALDKGCDDPTVTTYCADLVKCGDGGSAAPIGDAGVSSAKECERIARAMTPDGRQELKDCVAQVMTDLGITSPCDEGGLALDVCYDATKTGESP